VNLCAEQQKSAENVRRNGGETRTQSRQQQETMRPDTLQNTKGNKAEG